MNKNLKLFQKIVFKAFIYSNNKLLYKSRFSFHHKVKTYVLDIFFLNVIVFILIKFLIEIMILVRFFKEFFKEIQKFFKKLKE